MYTLNSHFKLKIVLLNPVFLSSIILLNFASQKKAIQKK
jgi:hypothetical protein